MSAYLFIVMNRRRFAHILLVCALTNLSACAVLPWSSEEAQPVRPPAQPAQAARPPLQPPPPATMVNPATPEAPYALLKPASWSDLPNLNQEQWLESWPVWLQSCQALKQKPEWREVCAQALLVGAKDPTAIANYWRQSFDVYASSQTDGRNQGLITGYYQPILKGSKIPNARYSVPLYKTPADLITVNLNGLFPELKFKRVRGRVNGQSLMPYYTRAEIEHANAPLLGQELVWVEDPVEAFFLQVQGSGMIELEGGGQMHIGYADQNGHPYQSIGRLLVERGEMTANEASMQSIKAWGKAHPEQLRALLDANPSYVFFKELPNGLMGPLGALGVPLTAARSVAIDPMYIPLGAPYYLVTTLPNQAQPLQQLMMAQDTGGAIKGGVRADVYWGAGEAASMLAGAMRQTGQAWVWLPKTFKRTVQMPR